MFLKDHLNRKLYTFNSKILNTLHSVPMEKPFSAGQPRIPQWKGSKVPSSPLFCLSVHQIFKSMSPGKLLRCNSETLGSDLEKCRKPGWTSWPEWGWWGAWCPSRWITMENKSLRLPKGQGRVSRGHGPPQALHAETSLGPLGCLEKPRKSDFNTCICSVKWEEVRGKGGIGLSPKPLFKRRARLGVPRLC